MCGESDDQIPPAGRSKWCAQTAAPHISATLETRKLTNRIHRWAFRRAPISTNPGGAAAFGSCLNASRTEPGRKAGPAPSIPFFKQRRYVSRSGSTALREPPREIKRLGSGAPDKRIGCSASRTDIFLGY